MPALFFESAEKFRDWLETNHNSERELLVGFYKKGSGRPSMTWPQSVDAALSYGWIDGVRKRIDDESYTIRFTPRKKGSTWSAVNIRRVEELKKLRLMRPAGLRAFDERSDAKSAIYSYENAPRELPPEYEKQFRRNRKAWTFFSKQPPGYRRVAIYFVTSAKKEETRSRRLAQLIDDSANGRRLPQYTLTARRRDP